jgi:hypothetical protein
MQQESTLYELCPELVLSLFGWGECEKMLHAYKLPSRLSARVGKRRKDEVKNEKRRKNAEYFMCQ